MGAKPAPPKHSVESGEKSVGREGDGVGEESVENTPTPETSMTEGPYISVVGAGEADGTLYEQAREVGRLVAGRGGIVVCGGLGGVMEAASRGASEAGGVAIGILPDEDRGRANRFLSYSISAGAGHARNLAVACSGDAAIAVGGEYGTLSEIGFAKKLGRVVVALSSWELGDHVILASSPEEAVAAAFEAVKV